MSCERILWISLLHATRDNLSLERVIKSERYAELSGPAESGRVWGSGFEGKGMERDWRLRVSPAAVHQASWGSRLVSARRLRLYEGETVVSR